MLPAISKLLFLLFFCALVCSHPTIYKRKDDETLSPVLVPVSSTVIPLPIYKVSASVEVKGKKIYDDDNQLITVKNHKNPKIGAMVKSLKREDFERKP